MTGYLIIKELNETGTFISELDTDKRYIDKGNPKGRFKRVIQTIENSLGQDEIKYRKVKDGFLVYGEAYVVILPNEAMIDKYIAKNFEKEIFSNLVFTEDNELGKECGF